MGGFAPNCAAIMVKETRDFRAISSLVPKDNRRNESAEVLLVRFAFYHCGLHKMYITSNQAGIGSIGLHQCLGEK